MTSRRVLAANVTFLTEGGQLVSLRAGDDVPSEYAEYLTNPALFPAEEKATKPSRPAWREAPPEDPTQPDYSALRKAELIDLAELRGLDTTGTVADLRGRLDADDEALRAD